MSSWTFPSSSSSAIYTTKQNTDGSLSCNCPAWRFKKGDAPRTCKHVREVEAQAKPKQAALHLVKGATKPVQTFAAPVQVVASAPTAPAPMLASAMIENVTGEAFDRTYAGWYLEEKHDGHRVTIIVGDRIVAWSRPRAGEQAKLRELPDTITAAMSHLRAGTYDGELVVPGGKAWDVTAIGSRLVFVAFDVLELDGNSTQGLSYEARRELLIEQLRKLPKDQRAVSTVESHDATWERVQEIWKRGGEGAILKRPGSKYRPGHRSPDWVKVKEQRSAVLTITGYEAGKCGPYSKIALRDDAGIETTVKTLGNAMLRDITANPDSYIGRRAVIAYQLKTPSGKYRHGVFDHFAD